jgi:hypothetical protein
MAGNRQAATELILKTIGKLLPGTNNVKIYQDFFAKLSDKEFEAYMKDLEEGKKDITVIIPNLFDKGVSLENNIQVGK